MAENLATIIFNGETRVIQLALKDAAGTAPLVITGWTMEFLLGGRGAEPLVRKPLSVTNGAAGECQTAAFTPAEIALVAPGTSRYVIRRTDAGLEQVVQYGTVPVEVVLI